MGEPGLSTLDLLDMYAFNDNHRGFTLVELIVAIAITALLTFGVAELLLRAGAAGKEAELLTRAALLTQAQVETVLSADYATISVGAFEPRHTIAENLERSTTVALIDPVTRQVIAEDRGLKQIAVTVFYPAPQGDKTFTLSTFISNH